jgi:hypothetical protein
VNVGSVADFSKAHSASVIRVEVSWISVRVYIGVWFNGVWLSLVTITPSPSPNRGSVGLKIYAHNKHLPIVFTSTLKIEAGCASETFSARFLSIRF